MRETKYINLSRLQEKLFTLFDVTLSYVQIVIKEALKEDRFTVL
jgi:hypothetical protein